MTKATSAAVMAALEDAAPQASEDQLERVRRKISEARDLEADIADLTERLAAKGAALTQIRCHDLPDLFQEVGIEDSLTITANGNLPAYVAELRSFYSAKLPDDKDPRREKAFRTIRWLAPLTKTRYVVDFGKGDEKKARGLAKVLKSKKIPFSSKMDVHASTLKAEVKRRFEDGKPLSPAEMELLGAFAGKIVNLKPKKED